MVTLCPPSVEPPEMPVHRLISNQTGSVRTGLAVAVALVALVATGVWISEAPDPGNPQPAVPGNNQAPPAVKKPEDWQSPGNAPAPALPQFDPYLSLAGVGAGDTLELYVPAEQRIVRAQVHSTGRTRSGNAVIKGMINDGGREFRFLFTVGDRQTFGTFQTGFDTYQLEIRGDSVEIVALSTIRQKRSYAEPDYVVKERIEPAEGRQETAAGNEDS